MKQITFGSVCSGIEAASVAWGPLSWEAAWFAEIEPFPAAVLAHHYPSTPNLGDMTKIAARVMAGEIEAPDVLCGGTPCQAFSVAGLRQSLDDARGNLTLKFVELANAIDHVRIRAGRPPSIDFWENVPGILSTKDNAFGCFLAGLAGEDEPLQPPGGKWSNAGAVYGPARAVAWRTLDAQYFGVAQRRRRVFVVASARNGFDPAAVLFEWDGVRRDSAPSRETGEEAAGTLASRTGAGGFPGTDEACSGYLQPVECFGGNRTSGPLDVSTALNASGTASGRQDFESETFVVHGDHSPAPVLSVSLRGREGGATAELGDEVAGCLRASSGGGDKPHVLVPLAFDTTQMTSAANRSHPKPGDPCHPLAAGAHAPAIAYTTKLHNTASNNAGKLFYERTPWLDANSPAPALLSIGVPTYAHATKTRSIEALRALQKAIGEEAFCVWSLGILAALQPAQVLQSKLHGTELRYATFSRSWLVYCALSRSKDSAAWLLQSLREAECSGCPPQGWEPSKQLAGELGAYLSELSQPGAQAARLMRDLWFATEGPGVLRQALSALQEVGRSISDQAQSALPPTQVRRLTTEECEFLQGFPRGYTAIPWRGKQASECPDGPRYKAIGNSWAVPVVHWLGQRIQQHLARSCGLY